MCVNYQVNLTEGGSVQQTFSQSQLVSLKQEKKFYLCKVVVLNGLVQGGRLYRAVSFS